MNQRLTELKRIALYVWVLRQSGRSCPRSYSRCRWLSMIWREWIVSLVFFSRHIHKTKNLKTEIFELYRERESFEREIFSGGENCRADENLLQKNQ